MPHVDELLGPATLAAAGLVVAIALQPVAGRHASPDAEARVAAVPAVANADRAADETAAVRLPPVEVVARRATETAGTECEGDGAPVGRAIAGRAADANA
ncbi:MAG: hypothetical protein IPI87_08075 [Betaproteobacteria bacterium]|nr:hypothetical protein [Betaproteobacteria bacterium]